MPTSIYLPLHLQFVKHLNALFPDRKGLATKIAQLIPAQSKVLDVGCDDGTTTLMIKAQNSTISVEGVDVQSERKSKIKRKLYDGVTLPYPDNHFDVVIALDVLHHTNHIQESLQEMARVSKKLVIIKDHAAENRFQWVILSILDYIGNAPFGITCEYNYPSQSQWRRFFKKTGLQQSAQEYMGNWGYRSMHPIFVLTKNKIS